MAPTRDRSFSLIVLIVASGVMVPSVEIWASFVIPPLEAKDPTFEVNTFTLRRPAMVTVPTTAKNSAERVARVPAKVTTPDRVVETPLIRVLVGVIVPSTTFPTFLLRVAEEETDPEEEMPGFLSMEPALEIAPSTEVETPLVIAPAEVTAPVRARTAERTEDWTPDGTRLPPSSTFALFRRVPALDIPPDIEVDVPRAKVASGVTVPATTFWA
jgi:hypothetical protein